MLKLLTNIFLFFITFLLTVFILDRFILFSESITPSLFGYDNKIGRTFLPGSNYLYTNEGLGMGSTNNHGYLNKEYPLDKDNGKFRIALVGDSYVEAFQLFDRFYFGRVMEKLLKEKYNIDAEVLNFGRSGFTFTDMYAYNKNFIEGINPDLILFFVENNDFLNVNKANGMPYPYLENDSLKIFYFPEIKNKAEWFLSLNQSSAYFPFLQMVRNSIKLNSKGQTPGIIFGKLSVLFSTEEDLQRNEITFKADSVSVKILSALSSNGKNIIVYRGKESAPPELISLANNLGITSIDINDTLKSTIESGFNPYYWKSKNSEGHWNIEAHKIIGEFLAARIYESLGD